MQFAGKVFAAAYEPKTDKWVLTNKQTPSQQIVIPDGIVILPFLVFNPILAKFDRGDVEPDPCIFFPINTGSSQHFPFLSLIGDNLPGKRLLSRRGSC